MSQGGLGRHIDVDVKTVNRWSTGRVPVPKVVLLYLERLVAEARR